MESNIVNNYGVKRYRYEIVQGSFKLFKSSSIILDRPNWKNEQATFHFRSNQDKFSIVIYEEGSQIDKFELPNIFKFAKEFEKQPNLKMKLMKKYVVQITWEGLGYYNRLMTKAEN